MKQHFTPTLGLDRMKSLMERLGNPQEKLKMIHVAGTNGKGSVCAMLNYILIESGYRVGLFTSPHIIDFNERIQIQNTPVDQERFKELTFKIEEVSKDMVGNGEETPTFFEYITAMGFLYFAQEEVDLVILETGIGGTYDATNIIKKPLISVITSIGKDHTAMLGHTIPQITKEKAGIIKQNSYTVLYDCPDSVYNNVKDICEGKKNKLLPCQDIKISETHHHLTQTIFTARHVRFNYENICLQLLGDHQISNAMTGLMTIEALKEQGYDIPKEAVYKGLKNTKWPGRMEVIQKTPMIILDGAHNVESAKAFTKALTMMEGKMRKDREKNKTKSKVYMLVGVLKDKDYENIMETLVPFAHEIIVTQVSKERALPARELYEAIKQIKDHPSLIVEEDIKKAYEIGKSLLNKNDILCCLGSLGLVADIKQLVKIQEESHVKI